MAILKLSSTTTSFSSALFIPQSISIIHRSLRPARSTRNVADPSVAHRLPCTARRASHIFATSRQDSHFYPLRSISPSDEIIPASTPPVSQAYLFFILNTLTNLFPLWVLAASLTALLYPPSFLWFQSSYIVPLLSLIMLGMGLTLSPASFGAVARTPKLVFIGTAAQYTLMPFFARTLAFAFHLPTPLAAGIILVGVCPGGTASNVVSLLAGADVALSVVLTLMSTLLSIVCIPFFMSVLAGTLVPVRPISLLLSTAQVVLFPLLVGALINRLWSRAVRSVAVILPLISVVSVTLICAGVVAANASALLSVGPRLIFAIATMHLLGGIFGYMIACAVGAPRASVRTISIEVMMQNSTLAVSLANAQFANPLTAVPGAISATMHSIFGSVLAGYWRWRDIQEQTNSLGQQQQQS